MPEDISVRPFDTSEGPAIEAAALMLFEGFKNFAPESWPMLDSAREELCQIHANGGFLIGAFDTDGTLTGWGGGLPLNGAAAWELHPLVVSPDRRRCGVGRAIVIGVGNEARRRGAKVLFVGSDDETGGTSLSGVDLWNNPLGHLANIQNLHHHPYEFYLRVGFKLVGVLPDANGPGKPDIWLAQRL